MPAAVLSARLEAKPAATEESLLSHLPMVPSAQNGEECLTGHLPLLQGEDEDVASPEL